MTNWELTIPVLEGFALMQNGSAKKNFNPVQSSVSNQT